MIFYILLISLNFFFINSKYPRNLKLGRNQGAYEKVAQAAKEAFFQIYNITIDFNNRYEVVYEDKNKKLMVVLDEYYQIVPFGYPNITFLVEDGEPMIQHILREIPDKIALDQKYLEIYDIKCDIKERFRTLANMIAAGWNNSLVLIYEKNFTNICQIRYKCLLMENDSVIGDFEIIQQDKDEKDDKHIKEKIQEWWNIIKYTITEGSSTTKTVAEIVSHLEGIWKTFKGNNKKEASSLFLKNPFILLIFLLI